MALSFGTTAFACVDNVAAKRHASFMPSASAPSERRERRRFPVRLKLDVDSGLGPTEAVSRDASEAGISFFCDSAIPAGSPVEFSVHVPPEVAAMEKIFVRGKGRVIRNEPQTSGRVLVAVVTDGYRFQD
jgi:hypothetical protein